VAGSVFIVNDSIRTDEVLISKYLSDLLQLKTGDRFAMYFIDDQPRGRSFRVAGIYRTSLMEFDKQLFWPTLVICRRSIIGALIR